MFDDYCLCLLLRVLTFHFVYSDRGDSGRQGGWSKYNKLITHRHLDKATELLNKLITHRHLDKATELFLNQTDNT